MSTNLDTDIKNLKENAEKNITELKKLSSFFKIFSTSFQEHIKSINDKIVLFEKNHKVVSQSVLSTNIANIFDNFKTLNTNLYNIIVLIQNDLINSLELFVCTELNLYEENISELISFKNKLDEKKSMVNISQKNYYHSINKAINAENKLKNKKDINEEEKDLIIKNKMEIKNYEILYRYEIENYNKHLELLDNEHINIQKNLEMNEKNRISIIKTSFDKYKKFINKYITNLNEYITKMDNFLSEEIFTKIEQESINQITNNSEIYDNTKFKEKFISYNEYYEQNKKEDKLNFEIIPIKKTDISDSKSFFNKLINEFMGENEINIDNIASLTEALQSENKELEKNFIDCLVEKIKTSLKFQNLKNLEHLSNAISYITLKESSIYFGKFEINFKIIFIAERMFYQNKVNNNKVYLSAILSKNKFYRTKLFWRNVMELKLSNKLEDHIERLKNYVLPGEKSKGFFSKIGNKIGLNNTNNSNSLQNSFISSTRISSIIKNYNEIDASRINLIDKMATKEMRTIIKSSIPSFSNFNFSSIPCLDLISQLSQEYRIPNEYINYFVIYYKVSNHTIRQLLPHEKNSDNDLTLNDKKNKIKIITNIIPFLNYKDYHNLLILSKNYNKSLKKKIYRYVLKQKNTNMKTRLSIWSNLLKIDDLKKKYNYKEVLNNCNDEKTKHEIMLDVRRTNVKSEEFKEKITNILYAISQLNGDCKYVQGMNFISNFLCEIYGEEEAFYIFLSFFYNTDYSLIFDKDLRKLKVFFYVFDRMISLFEPELYSIFTINNVKVNFFMTPWFITLFTGSHQYLKEDKDNSQYLIRIFDNFIVSGWKAMMKVGIALLHSYENVLLSKKYEDMLEFLINDMLKSDFFTNQHLEVLENFFESIKISKKLIRNIESEESQDTQLNEKEKK